jgi:type IV pilus assembly protein PilB
MAVARVRLGELLVDARVISREKLDVVLALQKNDGRRIGTLLVEAGLVTETQVTQILSQQLSVPWVSLYHIDFSRQLLNLVSQDLAEKYCLVPIFVRRVRGVGDTLYVAMDDPTDEVAQGEVAHFAGLPVRAMIAPPSDIRSAIRVYYGSGKDAPSLAEAVAETEVQATQRKSAKPAPAPAVQQQTASASAGARMGSAGAAAPAQDTAHWSVPPPYDSAPEIEAREISMPAPRRGSGARMVTLTLLDGTQVNLPARGSGSKIKTARVVVEGEANGGELTARDLVAALRAVALGADASEILGNNVRWETMFATLLAVLLKKHLIADWEFVEEYEKV